VLVYLEGMLKPLLISFVYELIWPPPWIFALVGVSREEKELEDELLLSFSGRRILDSVVGSCISLFSLISCKWSLV
jgi:hypothetical protein